MAEVAPQIAARVRLHQRFELFAPIGSGGVGTVWRARDTATGRDVALKVLHPHLRADRVVAERFRREADLCRRFAHPNVVRAHQLFEDADGLSFSLELLEGRTLKEAVLGDGALPIAEAVRIARACLAGLGAAHAAGIVHRDLKPQNVFLCANGEVKLLDFGFARVAGAAGLTTRSLVLCTPDYAPPEVVFGKPVDGRADLYALGVVLFEALTGTLPFTGSTPFELLQKHVGEAVPSPRALRSELPEPLERLVQRLLAKSPEDRFATCEAALAALDAWAAPPARPASACPTCQAPRDPRWPLCPSCGATERGHAAGDHMVVLTRAPAHALGALKRLVTSVGARPSRALEAEDRSIVKDLPKIVLKGIGEPLARLLRERALAGELQVELRRASENNSDLLHKSNTPGYLFMFGLALPWGVALVWMTMELAQGSVPLAAPIALALAGPALGLWVMKNAHLLLRPLASLRALEPVRQLPPRLVMAYRDALPQLADPALRATLVRLFERALVVHAAATEGKPHVQMLLEEAHRGALGIAGRAVEIALEAQAALDRLKQAGESRRWQELEGLRARLGAAPTDPGLAAAVAEEERALSGIAELEHAHLLASHRLLKAASAMEVVAVQALLAHATEATGVSAELKRVLEEARFAGAAARDITRETGAGRT